MKRLSLLCGKLALMAMKLRRGGSSLPGLVANRIYPRLLGAIHYPPLIIAVTGTNGKTSTANLIADIFRTAGLRVAHNTRGANMLSGLTTAIIEKTGFNLRLNADVLVLEIDEATVPLAFHHFQPHYLLINNFFRDQLERYGELETVIAKVSNAITPSQSLICNGNDPLTTNLAHQHPNNQALFFGVDKTNQSTSAAQDARESKWCPVCNSQLSYQYYHYSQIGAYRCAKCGFATPNLDYVATDVDLAHRQFSVNGTRYSFGYDNLYFLFNVMGAIALADKVGISTDIIQKALSNYAIGDGRMEQFRIRDTNTFLNLVKNPAGLNQTLNHILAQPYPKFSLFMALNNQSADSIDTSWIWDSAIEQLATERLATIICSGTRAYDLAVRLENAGVPVGKIVVLPEIELGLDYLRDKTIGQPFVLTNYTPLQPVRRKLISFPENQR